MSSKRGGAPLAVVFDQPPLAVEDHRPDRSHHVGGFERAQRLGSMVVVVGTTEQHYPMIATLAARALPRPRPR